MNKSDDRRSTNWSTMRPNNHHQAPLNSLQVSVVTPKRLGGEMEVAMGGMVAGRKGRPRSIVRAVADATTAATYCGAYAALPLPTKPPQNPPAIITLRGGAMVAGKGSTIVK